MSVDGSKMAQLMKEKVLSYGALEGLIDQNKKKEPSDGISQKTSAHVISKTELHRIANGGEKSVLLWKIRAIAKELGVPTLELLVEKNMHFSTGPDELQETKFQTVKFSRVEQGSEIMSKLKFSDISSFEIEVEPEQEAAQEAILEIISLINGPNKGSISETTKRRFNYKNTLGIFQKYGLSLCIGQAKEVAPFEMSWNEDEDVMVTTFFKVAKDYSRGRNSQQFDGFGFCDVTILRVDNVVDESLTREHDMNPLDLGSNDSYILENLARVSGGNEALRFDEIKNLNLKDFMSPKAREIIEKEKDDEM